MRRSLTAALAVTTLVTPLVLVASAGAASAAPAAPRTPLVDFNHDGYADLAISSVGGYEGTTPGKVTVVLGSASGPDTAHAKTFGRATPGVPGEPQNGGRFGQETAAADLDGDQYTDLVVNGYDGKAVVLWGSASGLSGQGSAELPWNGGHVTAGDFNGDGKRDLVTVDFPSSDDPDNDDQGMLISYGPFTRDGKAASTQAVATSRTFGPGGFVTGDVTGDGADDIVTNHGFEEMAYGSKFWAGGKDGVNTTPKPLAASVGGAIADVDKDGYGDLIVRDIGGNFEDMPYQKGTILIKYGTADGPSSTRTAKITQDTAGVPGVGEDGDEFGAAISAGDVNGDGYADVAVGVPGEDIESVKDAGSTVLLKGSRTGLTGTGAQAFQQSTTGVPGASEKNDRFGGQVLLSDTNKDGKADLTVSAQLEDGTYADSGAVWHLRGAASGLTVTGITSFGPKTVGLPENRVEFGGFLTR